MDGFAILALLHARSGKEAEVEGFLKLAQPLVAEETGPTTWYAIKIGPAAFGILETFVDEVGRDSHVDGAVAKALFARAEELSATPSQIHMAEMLASRHLTPDLFLSALI
jgi:quinol monooxygenase YgiN